MDTNVNQPDPVFLKQQLVLEVEALRKEQLELQEQLATEKTNALQDIQQWWQEKEVELEEVSKQLEINAREQGFQEGYKNGLAQAEEDMKEKHQEIKKIVETAYLEKEKIIQQAEPFILSLSIKIAEKIIKNELKQHSEQLIIMIRESLKQIDQSGTVVMQVSAEDYPIILPFMEELMNYVDSEFKLVPVPNLLQGGCMIHTDNGSYDVTIDSQLKEIRKQLLTLCEENVNDESKG
ncbi:MAG: flagellar assembly protein FliH [Bacillus sp. (in: Bacteria)]|nr:flagellar assembly protein FliH [Bacillus sp. (in: firmicutes)]